MNLDAFWNLNKLESCPIYEIDKWNLKQSSWIQLYDSVSEKNSKKKQKLQHSAFPRDLSFQYSHKLAVT